MVISQNIIWCKSSVREKKRNQLASFLGIDFESSRKKEERERKKEEEERKRIIWSAIIIR